MTQQRWRDGIIVDVFHSDEYWLISEFAGAINRAREKYELKNGKLMKVRNRYSQSKTLRTGGVDGRRKFWPEIRESGYYFWNRHDFMVLFHPRIWGDVILWYDEVDKTRAFITCMDDDATYASEDDFKNATRLTEWFLGRVLYHFSLDIKRIEILPHQRRPEW